MPDFEIFCKSNIYLTQVHPVTLSQKKRYFSGLDVTESYGMIVAVSSSSSRPVRGSVSLANMARTPN